MKFNLNNKGFSFSPYLMIVMMFLGIIMAFHFIVVDSEKAVAISGEGKVMKNALQIDGTKSAARSVILLAAYDAIDSAINPRGTKATTHTIEHLGLKDFLIENIRNDLNSVDSTDPNDGTGVGAFDKVSIDEKDPVNKDKIRTDGFIVSAEGDHYGAPMKLEKFVDSGVFAYYDKGKNLKERFLNLLVEKIKCKVYGVTCDNPYLGLKGNELLIPASIKCSARGYDEGAWMIVNDYKAPEDALKDASVVRERIEDGLREIAEEQIKRRDLSQFSKDADLVLGFNITHIDTTVSLTDGGPQERTEDIGQCCFLKCGAGEKGANLCVDDKYDEDYWTTLSISGSITVQELFLIGDATLKNDGDGYEVCVKTPIMDKDGAVKAMKWYVREFYIKYDISIRYLDNCDPGKVIKGFDEKDYDPSFPGYHINQDSLMFNNEPVKCEWGPKDPSYKPVCGTTKYVGGKECTCGGQGTHCRNGADQCCGSEDY